MHKPVVIVGCTASGKSDLAEALAERLGGALMAVDSMQVYRGMDIGTAKPDRATRERIPHLMIDVCDPWETYSAARFAADASTYFNHQDTKAPRLILVAGTILYLRALLEGMFEGPGANEEIRKRLGEEAGRVGARVLHERLKGVDSVAAGRIHPNDLRRIVRALEVFELTGSPISTLQTQWAENHPRAEAVFIGIRRDKEALNRRINARVRKMIEMGLVEEVDRLRKDPRGFSPEAASGVGYRQLLDHFAGKCSLDEAIEQIKIQTRHLAKLQRTWLKRFPPPQNVQWLEASEEQSGAELVEAAIAKLAENGSSDLANVDSPPRHQGTKIFRK